MKLPNRPRWLPEPVAIYLLMLCPPVLFMAVWIVLLNLLLPEGAAL